MKYRARLTFPKVGEWFDCDKFQAMGLFIDLDYEVQPVDEEARRDMWG